MSTPASAPAPSGPSDAAGPKNFNASLDVDGRLAAIVSGEAADEDAFLAQVEQAVAAGSIEWYDSTRGRTLRQAVAWNAVAIDWVNDDPACGQPLA